MSAEEIAHIEKLLLSVKLGIAMHYTNLGYVHRLEVN